MQFEMKERVVAEVARLLQSQTLLFFGKLNCYKIQLSQILFYDSKQDNHSA